MGEVVIVSGVSGSGKSFTGDYLEMCHGFHHIDGDYFFHRSDERSKELVKGIRDTFANYWFKDEKAPGELWHPYYDGMVELVQNAQKENPGKKIVLTHSVYRKEAREYLQKVLPGHTYIQLKIEGEVLFKRHKVRFDKFAAAQNQDPLELFEKINKKKYTEENFQSVVSRVLQGLEEKQEGENYFVLDVKEDIFEQLKQSLGLKNTPNPVPIEEIAQKNYDRFKKSEACAHWEDKKKEEKE